jgi:glycosyltransferase involved in cell wall biosynthesis
VTAVLQVSTSDVGGGGEAVALGLHRALRGRGHEAWLAVGKRRTQEPGVLQLARRPLAARPRVERVARALRDPRVAADFVRGREDFRFPATERLLRLPPRPPRVLHLHNLHGGYFDLRLLPELSAGVPTVVTLHDEWLYTGHCAYTLGSDGWLRGCGHCPHLGVYPALRVDGTAANWRRKRALYERARLHVVTPSEWLAERVGRSILAPAALSIRVVPNGVDLDLFRPGERPAGLGLDPEARVLVFAAQGARSNPYKDFATLRAALARLGDGPGPPVVAFSLGEAAPAERLGRVELRSAGFVAREQVAAHLRAADLYVHATRADNHPLAVLEALAAGTPVVASRVGGIPEQVSEETGMLVEPGNAEALAAALGSLLDDRPRLQRMSRAAAHAARERFCFERQVDAYVELYEELAPC